MRFGSGADPVVEALAAALALLLPLLLGAFGTDFLPVIAKGRTTG